MHKQNYTSYKLINPVITAWKQDRLNQSEGNKFAASTMTIEYESILYNTHPDSNQKKLLISEIRENPYDTTPSPLSIGGIGTNSLLGPGGVLAGANSIFGDIADIGNASPLDIMNTVIKGANIARNIKNISKAGLKEEGYGLLNSTLGSIRSQNQLSRYGSNPAGLNVSQSGNLGTSNTTNASQRDI